MRVRDRQLAAAEERLTALATHAATLVERAAVAGLRVDLYVTLDQADRAIAVSLDYLRDLGVEWSAHPSEDEARREYDRIWSQLGTRTIEDLIDLPLLSDPASLATLDILTKLVTYATLTDNNLQVLVGCRAVNLSGAWSLRCFMCGLPISGAHRRRAIRRLSGRVPVRSARL